jgi:hypothetical protein
MNRRHILNVTGLAAISALLGHAQPAKAAPASAPQVKSFGSYRKRASVVTFDALFNVASIQEQGTGTVQVRFQRPMTTNKYVVVVSAENTPVAWAWNRQPDSFWISTGQDDGRAVDFVVYGIGGE